MIDLACFDIGAGVMLMIGATPVSVRTLGISSRASVCSRAVGKAACPFSITKPLHILFVCASIYFLLFWDVWEARTKRSPVVASLCPAIHPRQLTGLVPLQLRLPGLALESVGD